MKTAFQTGLRGLKTALGGATRLASRARLGDAAKWLSRGTLDLVFPAACASCGTELGDGEQPAEDVPFCADCFDRLDLFAGAVCELCGAPVPTLGVDNGEAIGMQRDKPGCYRCWGHKLWFDATIAAGAYEGLLRDLILRMKTAQGDALSLALGRLIWRERKEQLRGLAADVVAPIPLHWRRRIAHQTNSAGMIAEIVASRLRLPLAAGLLRRRRHTVPQSQVTPTQRWKNVRAAFSLSGGQHLKQAHVLLVDDILTTGATCSEAARTLREAGAARVTVVVAARALGS